MKTEITIGTSKLFVPYPFADDLTIRCESCGFKYDLHPAIDEVGAIEGVAMFVPACECAE